MLPTVSVIIPTYNRSQYILESIESVFNQHFQDFEIWVVDDGSTDDTKIILDPLIKQNRIKYLRTSHRGASHARNTGVKHSKGRLIAFLDSDDLFCSDKLGKQVRYFEENPKAIIVHSDFTKFDDAGNFLGTRYPSFFKGEIYPQMLAYWEMLIAISCVMVRAELFSEIGLFDEKLRYAEDLDMWARIAKKYSFHYIPESLAKIRIHAANQSWNRSKMAKNHLPYIQKSIAANPKISKSFAKTIHSKLYCYMGLNILGDGSPKEMQIAQKAFWKSIKYRPLQIKSWTGLLISFVNKETRILLAGKWRKFRNKKLSRSR